jgi:hypothetical protein
MNVEHGQFFPPRIWSRIQATCSEGGLIGSSVVDMACSNKFVLGVPCLLVCSNLYLIDDSG